MNDEYLEYELENAREERYRLTREIEGWKGLALVVASAVMTSACAPASNQDAFTPTPGVKMDWQAVHRDAEAWAKAHVVFDTKQQAKLIDESRRANAVNVAYLEAQAAEIRKAALNNPATAAALADWARCTTNSARQFAQQTSDSALAIVAAALASCRNEQAAYFSVIENRGGTYLAGQTLGRARAAMMQALVSTVSAARDGPGSPSRMSKDPI